ncbi:MAG TPA: hypothetical protein VEK33_14275 [Terriglobales bacterium]|nr:hypothetical protein [Terriglobales bacterium]
MNSFASGFSWIARHRWILLVAGAVGIAAFCKRSLETGETRAEHAQHKRIKYLRNLADRISAYAREIHQRYPTGDVVVSVPDLAEQLGKRPEAIASALDLLFGEQKVQRAPLEGYWKLNV